MKRVGILLFCLVGMAVGAFAQPFAVTFEGVVPKDAFDGVWGKKVDVTAVIRSGGGISQSVTDSVSVSTNGYLNVTLTFADGTTCVPGASVEWHFAGKTSEANDDNRFATQRLETVPYAVAAGHAASAELTEDVTLEGGVVEIREGALVNDLTAGNLALARENSSDPCQMNLSPAANGEFALEGAAVVLHGADKSLPFVGAAQPVTNVTIGGTSASSVSECTVAYTATDTCILAIDVSGHFGPDTQIVPADFAGGYRIGPSGLLGIIGPGKESEDTPFWVECQRTYSSQLGYEYDWLRPWLTLDTPGCKSDKGVSSRLTMPMVKGESCTVKLAFASLWVWKFYTWQDTFDAVKWSGTEATLKLSVCPVKAWEVVK